MSEPLDRPAECDIIMKGGITSGVVYPLAVCELAKTYRFRSIGGTSAGAIAAALTAAAEYARGKPDAGFERLDKLPGFLGEHLLSLFQPSPETRPAFAVLLSALGNSSKARKGYRALNQILSFYWLTAILGILIGTVIWSLLVLIPLWMAGGEIGAGLLPGLGILQLLCAVLAAVAHFGWGAWKAVNKNNFGLCKGMGQAAGKMALTPWLAEELNRAAGLDPKGRPLTFGDLWGGAEDEKHRAAQEIDPSLRQINLEVMTTSLTHGSPRRIPFSTRDLFFDPEELRTYFPEEVMHWMETHPCISEDPKSLRSRVMRKGGFLPLPAPWDFPVVVAARMSLSFPGLISAVPLHGVDWSLPDNHTAERAGEAPRLDPCWFSDGGIGSNFPVHFFDGLLPSRPTFGINLRPFTEEHRQNLEDESANVDFPVTAREEVLPTWTAIENPFQFVLRILDTMQNWVDNTQMRLPGYRDRVVHVLLAKEEGGMNLTMGSELIKTLAKRGQAAGVKLTGFNWAGHRWTRYLTAMSQLQLRLDWMERVYQGNFRSFLVTYDCTKAPYARPLTWKREVLQGSDSIMTMVDGWRQDGIEMDHSAPRPEPELRIGPKR